MYFYSNFETFRPGCVAIFKIFFARPFGARDLRVVLLELGGKVSVHECVRLVHSKCLAGKQIKNLVLSATLLDHPYSKIENFFRSRLRPRVTAEPTKETGVRNDVFCVIFFSRSFQKREKAALSCKIQRKDFTSLLQIPKFLRSRLRRSRRMSSFRAGGAPKV